MGKKIQEIGRYLQIPGSSVLLWKDRALFPMDMGNKETCRAVFLHFLSGKKYFLLVRKSYDLAIKCTYLTRILPL